MEEEKKEHEQKMKKMEGDMEQVFEIKVKEKMQKLADSEADVRVAVCCSCLPVHDCFLDVASTPS